MVRQITHEYEGLEITLRALVNRDRGTLARFNRALEDAGVDNAEAWAFARLCHQWVSAKGNGWEDWQPPELDCTTDTLRESYDEWSMLALETGLCAGQAMDLLSEPVDPALTEADSADPNEDGAP